MERPSPDENYLTIAEAVSARSTCLHRHVGCVAVRDGRLLAVGYNGAPSGLPHCGAIGCARPGLTIVDLYECRGVHAEMNVVIQAAHHGVSLYRSTFYCTDSPCKVCAKMMINAGVRTVIARRVYDEEVLDLLSRAGIQFILKEAKGD